MIFWVKKKKKTIVKRGKKWLSAKSQCHMAGAHALLHEISAFIYIYIYIQTCIQSFFRNWWLPKEFNNTFITLIPKGLRCS